jgi:hypothetical protein
VQVVKLLYWHLANLLKGGVHGPELIVQELDALPHVLVQLVLTMQQLEELGKQGVAQLRCTFRWRSTDAWAGANDGSPHA